MRRRESLLVINRSVAQFLRLNASRSAFARSAAAAGVPLSQPAYLLLRAITESAPISMSLLAQTVHMDPGSAARQVAKLVTAGYAKREVDSDDRRISLVDVTPKGRAAGQRLLSVRMQHLARSVSEWSEGDLATFAGFLDRFVEDMAATSYAAP